MGLLLFRAAINKSAWSAFEQRTCLRKERYRYAEWCRLQSQQIFQLGIRMGNCWAAQLCVTILSALYTLRSALRKVYNAESIVTQSCAAQQLPILIPS